MKQITVIVIQWRIKISISISDRKKTVRNAQSASYRYDDGHDGYPDDGDGGHPWMSGQYM